MITAQIIVQNDENTIENCLKSLLCYNLFDFDIINIGSTDKTLEICNDYKLKITNINNIKNYSIIRNENLTKHKTKFSMYIYPYETLIYNKNFEKIIKESNSYFFKVIQGNVLTKELRLWSNKTIKFKNPVFEYLDEQNGIFTDLVILSEVVNYNCFNSKLIINNWKKNNPTKPEPYYYEAFQYLKEKDYLNFKNISEHYLFLNKINNRSSTMIKYYLALIQLHCFNDINSANSNILKCILHKPLMAEFWCLLGDIFYKIQDRHRALEFYENAILLGSQRKESDNYPLDILKYKKYPEEMINKLKNNI